ncbi:hypothetical protein MBLNU459_g2358t1 [Dothideomycetes sp. NU459]
MVKRNKILVVLTFGVRIFIITPVIFRLTNFSVESLVTNPTLALDNFIVWTQTEMNFSLISCTMLCLSNLIRELGTGYGAFGISACDANGNESKIKSRLKNDQQSFEMADVRSAGQSSGLSANAQETRSSPSIPENYSDAQMHAIITNIPDDLRASSTRRMIIKPFKMRDEDSAEDQISLSSNDSRKLIIQKT